MKRYLHYQINDFIQDESFVTWCLTGQSDDKTQWNNLQDSVLYKDKITKAKQIVYAIHEAESTTDNFSSDDELWQKIDSQISQPKSNLITKKRSWTIGIAASVLLCAMLTYQLFHTSYTSDSNVGLHEEWINIENTNGISMTVNLPDESVVVLEPFSSLKYPNQFKREQRSVFLIGEAFFDIKRDTLKPFLVYANETITKVLGTSFTIKAYEGQETVEVDVKSGKVAVYAKVASEKKSEEKRIVLQTDEEIIVPLPNKKLEVTPNHRVVFDRKIEVLTRRITTVPIVVKELNELKQFEFKDESASKVFDAISEAYAVRLDFEKEDLRQCMITTKLRDEPLFQVLEILCTALNLQFKEVDAGILITGNGCS